MDEQNPRVGRERLRSRGEDWTAAREHTDTPRTAAPRGAGRKESEEPRTRDLRRQIDSTREDLSETVNAIQDRLRPGRLASHAAKGVRDAAVTRARDVADSEPVRHARANPLPLAMVGAGFVGLTWLAFAGRGEDAERRYPSRRRRDSDAGSGGLEYRTYASDDLARTSYGDLEEDSSSWPGPEDLERRWEETSRRARHTARRAQGGFQRIWNENPLLIAAATAAAGAIVGLAVPETRREHELMGPARDSMVDSMQTRVREKVDQVGEAASNAVGSVQDAAKAAAGAASSSQKPPGRSKESGGSRKSYDSKR